MDKVERAINFELIAGCKYPIKVTKPDGSTLDGYAKCEDDIIFRGAMDSEPGLTALQIDDLAHIDEIDNLIDHESTEEMILFAVNDGSRMASKWDSGISFKLFDVCVTCKSTSSLKVGDKKACLLSLEGMSAKVHHIIAKMKSESDCLFTQPTQTNNVYHISQKVDVTVFEDELDTIKEELSSLGVIFE
tara:strand:- start:519 stop:1085 length:567 start_codon:yes stop_codon:yes gene_type:complete